MPSRLKRILQFDWDVVAGIIAALAALVMHFLHVIEADVLLMILLVLVALLFLRDLRRERTMEGLSEGLRRVEAACEGILGAVTPPDAVLIGPLRLREESERFARRAAGEVTLFHVCLLMFRSQDLFDTLLRPAIENPRVTAVRFTLDPGQKELWEEDVAPKIGRCAASEKVQPPHWTSISENVSFILARAGPEQAGECLLSFWGEPFMSQVVGRPVPRYIFHVQPHSELVSRLLELDRNHRIVS